MLIDRILITLFSYKNLPQSATKVPLGYRQTLCYNYQTFNVWKIKIV